MISDTQITFSEAKSNSELKQAYLDIVLESCSESVQGVVYDPEWLNRNAYMDRLVDENHLDGTEVEKIKPYMKDSYFLVIFSPSLLGTGRKHPIFVSDNGFGKMKSKPHFLSSILDHEELHTDNLRNGMRLSNDVLIDHTNIDELNPKIVINLRGYCI